MRAMIKSNLLKAILLGAVVLTGISSCNRENGTGRVQVRMLDAPSPYAYDAIYLDVRGVEVNVDEECCEPKWVTMHSGAGVYNMLTLVNGVDVLLVNEDLPAGRIEQVRLILGEGNTIIVDGISYPLTIPSGSESGLKINVHQDLPADGNMTLMLDFDAAHSILKTGNGDYKLKPVIRGYVAEDRGAIHGTVTTARPGVAIFVDRSDATITASTYANASDGQFLVRGLTPGTYVVTIYYPESDIPVRIRDVVVTANITTEIDL